MTVLVGEEEEFNIELAEMLDMELVPVTFRSFKDGEICPRIADRNQLIDETVVLCLRKTPEENPNDYLNKFLFTAGCIREFNRDIVGIMPYLPYARQDKDFLVGQKNIEPNSSIILLDMISQYTGNLITFNSHFQRKQGVTERLYNSGISLRFHNLDAFNLLNEELSAIEDLVIIAPDKGMRDFAADIAKKHKCEFDYLEKERDRTSGEIKFLEKEFDISGKNVVIPDDMVSSGSTLVKGIDSIRQHSPERVYAMFVHGAFSAGAYKQLEEVSDGLLFTDTVKNTDATVNVAPYLVQHIRDAKLLNL